MSNNYIIINKKKHHVVVSAPQIIRVRRRDGKWAWRARGRGLSGGRSGGWGKRWSARGFVRWDMKLEVRQGCWGAFGEAVAGQHLFAFLNCRSSCHGYCWGNGL